MDKKVKLILGIVKVILYVVLLPVVLIWYVWNKTDWKTRNKWVATVSIACVFMIMFFSNQKDDRNTQKEIDFLAEIARLQRELVIERQKNVVTPVKKEIEDEIKTFQVSRVIDGDTLKLSDGEVVRFIGIDAPEVVGPKEPVQCFGEEVNMKTKEMLEGKTVTLVKDISNKDQYGRLLRYVYLEDVFVNDYLVRQGFARVDNFPPDEKFRDQFKSAQNEAKENKRGFWADGVCEIEGSVSEVVSLVETAPESVSVVPEPVPAPRSAVSIEYLPLHKTRR